MPDSVFVGDGDSITLGYLSSPATSYVAQLVIPAGPWDLNNEGISGNTLALMITNGAANIDSLYVAGVRDVLVAWGGTNDFAINGSTPSAVYSLLQTYVAARKLAGWKVIVVTMISRTGTNPTGHETLDVDKNSYNTLIRAGWSGFADGLADVAANANLGADGAYSNTTYFQVDGIHPTNLSIDTIETPIIQAAVNLLLSTGAHAALPAGVFAQSNTNNSTASTQTLPFLKPNAKGSGLFAMVRTNTGSAITISDTNTSWNSLPVVTQDGVTDNQFWYLVNCAGGPNTVTCACAGATVQDLVIEEWTSIASFRNYLQGLLTSATPSKTVASGKKNDLLIGYTANNTGPSSITAGTNMTHIDPSAANVAALGGGLAPADVSSLGFTISANIESVIGSAAFVPAKPTSARIISIN